MRIGVVGAGAIGGWIAAKLAGGGHRVSVLARGATLAALRAHGLSLTEADQVHVHAVPASADAADLGVQDVVILAVKGFAMPDAAAAAGGMIGRETLILPMLNGVPWWFIGEGSRIAAVDPAGRTARALPIAQVLGCVVHAATHVTTPGAISVRFADRLILGEPGGGTSERATLLASTISAAGVRCNASDDVRSDIWYKLWGNMTINPLSALTLATADRILDEPLTRQVVTRVMEEARALGALIGCPIAETPEDRHAVTRTLGAFRTSMLQDVDAGRTIELEALLGAPRELAQAVGLATPWMDALYAITRLMAQSRGLM
jgi:2-dehydropantoate 2-reductase